MLAAQAPARAACDAPRQLPAQGLPGPRARHQGLAAQARSACKQLARPAASATVLKTVLCVLLRSVVRCVSSLLYKSTLQFLDRSGALLVVKARQYPTPHAPDHPRHCPESQPALTLRASHPRRGETPVDHARANAAAVRRQSAANCQRRASEAAAAAAGARASSALDGVRSSGYASPAYCPRCRSTSHHCHATFSCHSLPA